MFEKIKQKVKAVTVPTNTAINPETGVLSVDEMLGQTPPAQSEIETGPDASERPDDPAAIEPKAPLVEAESLLAWLKTQPSTPENKAMRAQAGIVVDYLKAK